MKVLVIGSGGREHALVWKLAQSPLITKLYAYPGNPGIARSAELVDAPDAHSAALSIRPDLTVVGPEAPLASGLVDSLHQAHLPVVGPTQAAAQLEASKIYAKRAMADAGVPTARFAAAFSTEEALAALPQFGLPVVIKADGLAAGKGVIIAHTREEAEQAVQTLGPRLVIEECLTGEEVSFIVLSDGEHVLPLEPTQDHKALLNGDQGPNTGGMGAYCDSRILTTSENQLILDSVVYPIVKQMRRIGHPFSGFLYAGLMMTPNGPSTLEFNVRLGDPETQALMYRLDSDLLPVLNAAAHHKLQDQVLSWKPDPSVCLVLAAEGYPGQITTGDLIQGVDAVRDAVVFHAGTRVHSSHLVTAGGRVLGVTASGGTLQDAIRRAYAAAGQIEFRGMQYRRDIGQKGLRRWNTVTPGGVH